MPDRATWEPSYRRAAPRAVPRRDATADAEAHPLLQLQRAVGNAATLGVLGAETADAPRVALGIARGGGASLLARTPAAAAPAPTVDAVAAKMGAGTLALGDAAAWATLAGAGAAALAPHERTIHAYFKAKVDAAEVGFETITADQRKVFRQIAAADREALRRKAIQASRLFTVITEMQTTGGGPAERAEMSRIRMDGSASFDWMTGTLADKFAEGLIMPEMLVAAVPAAPAAANDPVAKYVRRVLRDTRDPDAAKRRMAAETKWMACGLANLFAIAASRGEAVATEDGARAWLKSVVLDVPPEQALVQRGTKWGLQTSPTLKGLSRTDRAPAIGGTRVGMSGAAGPARLQQAMAYANALDSRVGVMQGTGHMYIVYRDMDDVWRTMDMYLTLADLPEGGAPAEAGTKFQKAIVD